MKSIAFAVMMVMVGCDVKADDVTDNMNRFANLSSYDLCYETQMAEDNGDKLLFVMGMYEMANRELSPMDIDCFQGRSDYYSERDSIDESLEDYRGEGWALG